MNSISTVHDDGQYGKYPETARRQFSGILTAGKIFAAVQDALMASESEIDVLARRGDTSNDAIAMRLKCARETTGLTQEQLADAVGVQTNRVSNWEIGKGAPRPPQSIRICRTLNVTADFLLFGVLEKVDHDVRVKLIATLEGK